METQRKRGFTLVEMLVVLVIATLVVSLGYTATRNRMAAQAAETFIGVQAREMIELADAVQKFVDSNKSGWPQNQLQTITIPQLQSGGFLPANWANRHIPGVNPIGEAYAGLALKDSAGVTRALAIDGRSAPTDALARRAGYQATDVSLSGYKMRVAAKMLEVDPGIYAGSTAGVIPPVGGQPAGNPLAVRGTLGSFSRVLETTWFPTPPRASAIVFVGWPEYRRPGPETPGAGEGFSCSVVNGADFSHACVRQNPFTGAFQGAPCWSQSASDAATHYRDPIVPAGASFVTRIPICGAFGILSPGAPGVGITFGTFQRRLDVTLPECWANGVQFERTTATALETYESVRLNDGELFQTTCSAEIPERDANCNIIMRGRIQDAQRVVQTSNTVIQSVNGFQTFAPLQPMPTNTLSQAPQTRGHWFFCVPAT